MRFSNAAKAGVTAGLDKIGECMQENFESRQVQFKPLAASTILHRKYLGFAPAPILIASGTLQQHIADEKSEVTISGSVASGTVSPSTTAKTDYSDEPISAYAAKLNKIREFWVIDNSTQIEQIKQAMLSAFVKEFNHNG